MSKEHKENSYTRIKKGESPKFKKGNPGRPKGAKDKVSRTVKQNIEETFQRLGGIEGLVKWANKSNYNKEKVYNWYFSMLPKNIDANMQAEIRHKLSIEEMVKAIKGFKDANSK
ncbi:MAG: hypothetical protein ACOC5F_06440 [Candidatus Aminicenantaceae bacterium]